MILALEVLGLVVMVVAHVVLQRRSAAFFEARVREQDEAEEGRRVAIYKQQKATERNVAKSDAAVRKLADRTRYLQEEAENAQRRAESFFSDPAVKRALRKAGGEDGR